MATHSIPNSAPQGQHALYRFYGDTGQLLYVGITHDPGKRLAQHTATKHWWTAVRGISLDWYSSREDALAAERRAITVERPLMNVQRPSVMEPPERTCGHCFGCVDPDGEHCEIFYYGVDELGRLTRDPCTHCGKQDCVYEIGKDTGSMEGWQAACHYYKVGRGGH